ncbi:MAG TPA: hypothetical protein VJ600_03705 [Holophagaceae bacterium]|nr:hypothetical protein [Holophagaceae bacterium]
MKRSRSAKRYDESILPGEFQGFEPMVERDGTGRMEALLLREGGQVHLGQVVVARGGSQRLSFDRLRTKAELLADQVDFLGERLEIVDHDRRGMFIQLRSLPPQKDDQGIQFNEINLGRDGIVVKRIAFSRREETKRQVPLTLTEGTLQRLLSELRQAIA